MEIDEVMDKENIDVICFGNMIYVLSSCRNIQVHAYFSAVFLETD